MDFTKKKYKLKSNKGLSDGAVVPMEFAKLYKSESENFPKNKNKENKRKKKSKEPYVSNTDVPTSNINSTTISTGPIKSIVKKNHDVQDSTSPDDSVSNKQSKAKKRTKSVSFSLDNELLTKKCKSEETLQKKHKKNKHFKENLCEPVIDSVDNSSAVNNAHKKSKNKQNSVAAINSNQSDSTSKDIEYLVNQTSSSHNIGAKTKHNRNRNKKSLTLDTELLEEKCKSVNNIQKKDKKKKNTKENICESVIDSIDNSSEVSITHKKIKSKNKENKVSAINSHLSDNTLKDIESINLINKASSSQNVEVKKKHKKNKNKKMLKSHIDDNQVIENQIEISDKSIPKHKDKQVKDIQESIENLNIGDNASTITSLLDDMKVAEKRNPKKKKKKAKKVDMEKKPKEKIVSTENGRINKRKLKKMKKNANMVKTLDQPIKPKWQKKWNRDRRIEFLEEDVSKVIIIDNIPLKFILNYRKLFGEHFMKFGPIKKIGVIELYPSQEPMPVFTTTILYQNADSAKQALEEDNMLVGGSRVRVRRMSPTTETGIVVRSYRPCCEQTVSSIFAPCGRLRTIKVVSKGSKANIWTAFVEFDSADAVERALKMAGEATIGGKRIFVSRFEYRARKGDPPKAGDMSGAEDESGSASQVPVLRMADVDSDTEDTDKE